MSNFSDQYVVVGHPVAHSKSPRIHTLFAQATGQNLHYSTLLAPLNAFAETIQTFFAAGGKACNVTVPFKQEAWSLADELSVQAKLAGAVNTLMPRPDGRLYGHNTDGLGLLRDLQLNHHLNLKAKRILLLGAGGAVRGVLQPLLEAKPAEIFIANRTVATAETLVEHFTPIAQDSSLAAGGFQAIQGSFDLIINGTAASLQGDLPPLPEHCLAEGASCYDMMYAAEPTAFVRWAQAQGAAKALDGLGMLVEQAAESFALWRGVRPDTAPVLRVLRG
ncbi:MAG: shikimate dehydrogenase [Proteobacteria bacterium]|nr:MAG: shikimate dehydrogenase [Pseudomonadota bacterium]